MTISGMPTRDGMGTHWRAGLTWLAAGVGLLVGCAADPGVITLVGERDALRREVAVFRALDALGDEPLVDATRDVIVSVSDTLIRSLFDAALPIEIALPGSATAVLTNAMVSLRGNVAQVTVTGTIRRHRIPRTSASVILRGAVDRFVVDSTRILRARTSLDDVTVGPTAGEAGTLALWRVAMLQSIVERALPELEDALPSLAIPVRIEQSVRLPGFRVKTMLEIKSISAPMSISVARVVAFQNRLWITLRTTREPFRTDSAGPS